MERINQLGYLGLNVANRNEWADFARDILGVQVEANDNVLKLRMDEYAQRFRLHQNDVDDLAYIGWEVASGQDLDAICERLSSAGVTISDLPAEEIGARQVRHCVQFADPSGIVCELYYGAQRTYEKPFYSPRPISGFVTGEQGLGHIVLAVDDAAQSLHFYRDLLGMRESDFIRFGPPERERNMTFLHCNPRHHTLAFLESPSPKRLLHFMLQVDALDDVGSTYYLCQERGVPIASTLGRHTNDHMVSFYMNSPSGFEIEYGWGARTIDDATWTVQTHRAPSIWGHQRQG